MLHPQVALSELGDREGDFEKRFGKPSVSQDFKAGEFAKEVDKPIRMLIIDRPGCEITVFLADGQSCREIYDYDKAIAESSDPRIQEILAQKNGNWREWDESRIKRYFIGTPPKFVWGRLSINEPERFVIVDGDNPKRVEVQSEVWREFLN
jgi:hypothetical protein